MKRADVKTGFLCNNACLFCVQGRLKKRYGNKDTAAVKKIISAASHDCDGIVFTGGEPTIREDICELIEFAKKLGFRSIQIQSNGRMFAYRDFCQRIIAAGANEFALALHGHIPELHNFLTGAPSFSQTVSGIRNLVGLKQAVITNTVITKSNYRHLPEIVKLFIGLNVAQSQLAFIHGVGDAAVNFDRVVPRLSMIMPYVKNAIRIGDRFGKKIMVETITPCFMLDLEEHISEQYIPDTKIYDYDYTINDYRKSRINSGKAKGSLCRKCSAYNRCEGPWKEYPQKFGWEEFRPI